VAPVLEQRRVDGAPGRGQGEGRPRKTSARNRLTHQRRGPQTVDAQLPWWATDAVNGADRHPPFPPEPTRRRAGREPARRDSGDCRRGRAESDGTDSGDHGGTSDSQAEAEQAAREAVESSEGLWGLGGVALGRSRADRRCGLPAVARPNKTAPVSRGGEVRRRSSPGPSRPPDTGARREEASGAGEEAVSAHLRVELPTNASGQEGPAVSPDGTNSVAASGTLSAPSSGASSGPSVESQVDIQVDLQVESRVEL